MPFHELNQKTAFIWWRKTWRSLTESTQTACKASRLGWVFCR